MRQHLLATTGALALLSGTALAQPLAFPGAVLRQHP